MTVHTLVYVDNVRFSARDDVACIRGSIFIKSSLVCVMGGLWGLVVDLYTKYMAFHRPMLFILIYFYTPSMLLNNVRSEESNRHRETERDTSTATVFICMPCFVDYRASQPGNSQLASCCVHSSVNIIAHK